MTHGPVAIHPRKHSTRPDLAASASGRTRPHPVFGSWSNMSTTRAGAADDKRWAAFLNADLLTFGGARSPADMFLS